MIYLVQYIHKNYKRCDIMTIGLELKQLCEEFIDILYLLKEKDIISKQELDICLEKKISFIKEFSIKSE